MEKICLNCNTEFGIFPEDQNFYRTMKVPEPTLCYLCRMQRRLAWRNERCLYHRKCDLTGKQLISAFSIDKPFPVYDMDVWWSDACDPLSYGQNFDFNRPFFEQFFELRNKVPRLARQQQQPMINSDYCHCVGHSKNCYLMFATNRCEDCYYGTWVNDSRNCIDNLNIEDCELCYECVSCRSCYNLKFSQDCVSCSDSYFLRNCTGCRNCFGSANLVQREYVIFNQQKTKTEYEQFLKNLNLGSYQKLDNLKAKINGLFKNIIVKAWHGTRCENCFGDYLRNCKNAWMCFECDDCEDVRYGTCLQQTKNSMDYTYWGMNAEWIYECLGCGYDVCQLRFCHLCWGGCSDLTYCDHCFASKHCFGCVGLKRGEYCILNKQYGKEEYFEFMERIVEHMKKTKHHPLTPSSPKEGGFKNLTPTATGNLPSPQARGGLGWGGEWGEFFPIGKSVYAYNESLANEYMSLTKGEVLAKGWQWLDEEDKGQHYLGAPINIPDNIANVDDSICEKILSCEVTKKHYKIIPQELRFYREMGLPLPRKCPDERHKERLTLKNPRRLFDRACQKCRKAIRTTYGPERTEMVYCEECYLKEVY